MTPHHVDDEALAAFVDGTLDDENAARVALHIDTCPACANRAVGCEPLAAAFAAIDDPVVPKGLAAAAVRRAAIPRETTWLEGLLAAPRELAGPRSALPVEMVVGSLLIAAATALAWVGGEPYAGGIRIARLGRVAWNLADMAGANVPSAVVLPLVVVVGFAVVVMLGRADEDGAAPTWGGVR